MQGEIDLNQAAARLGVTRDAVRKLVANGRLPGLRRGRDWFVDVGDVERLARLRPGAGRALSPRMAWAVLLLCSGDSSAASRVAGRDRYVSRARSWAEGHRLADAAGRLRGRAQAERFDVHPSELARILERSDVLRTGASAGELAGLTGTQDAAEVYAPAGLRASMLVEHGLAPGRGPVLIRWVADDLWPDVVAAAQGGVAPRAAVMIDLLESDDPRARREAAAALSA